MSPRQSVGNMVKTVFAPPARAEGVRDYSREPINKTDAEAIWRVLVEECGCRDDERQLWSFARYLSDNDKGFPKEWRFQGSLGFGGKFYNDHFSWRVGCYSEDRTSERNEMIRCANERLSAMRAAWFVRATQQAEEP